MQTIGDRLDGRFEMETGPDDPAQLGALTRVARGAGRLVGAVGAALFMPYSGASYESVEGATADRRSGDRENAMTVDVGPWVNTEHRT